MFHFQGVIMTNCLYCNKLLVKRDDESNKKFNQRKYCNISCSNKRYTRKKLTKQCLMCKKLIRSYKVYCSNKCRNHNSFGQKRMLLCFENKIYISSVRLKKLMFKFGVKQTKCECCNLELWNNKPLSLALHHIDGDKLNNRLDNLQILCPNCHSQTDNYGSKNKNICKNILKCNNCTKDIIKKYGESWSEYQTRKFCCMKCSSVYNSKNKDV